MDKRKSNRRKGEVVESLKASFWLKVIALILTLTMTGVGLAVTILFSIYETTATINERGYLLSASIERNTILNKLQEKRLNKHDEKFEVFDVRLTEQERLSFKTNRTGP